MAQKETLSSLIHGNFARELSISDGKMPPNAVEFEKLVIGTFLIDKKGHIKLTDFGLCTGFRWTHDKR